MKESKWTILVAYQRGPSRPAPKLHAVNLDEWHYHLPETIFLGIWDPLDHFGVVNLGTFFIIYGVPGKSHLKYPSDVEKLELFT